MIEKRIINRIKEICRDVVLEEPLCRHTTFRVGGPCAVIAKPCSAEEVRALIVFCAEEHVPFFIMGRGSNVLAADSGFDGVVIRIGAELSSLSIEDGVIRADAGCTLSALSSFACENEIGGFEFLSGIPGTVGGGVRMNAGAYGGEIVDLLIACEYVRADGIIRRIPAAETALSYRSSIFTSMTDAVILSAEFSGTRGVQKAFIKEKISELNMRRKEKQPLEYASAGSTFKRPEGGFAAKMIEDCGLKGYRYGNAAVSEKHSGFVVNLGGATCEEILHVIRYVRRDVQEKLGVLLEPEIVLIGNISF